MYLKLVMILSLIPSMQSEPVVALNLRLGVYLKHMMASGLRPDVYSELVMVTHFRWKNRYLLLDGPQIYVASHVLDRKADICY